MSLKLKKQRTQEETGQIMESIDRHTFWTLHRNFISNIVHDYFPWKIGQSKNCGVMITCQKTPFSFDNDRFLSTTRQSFHP